ncbi:MAG: histidinol-phosphate transaminase [Deltaproteobacteria bacterium]|nr:histidinol-phosphate transaminase [Deltaproteobacteria bacterium]
MDPDPFAEHLRPELSLLSAYLPAEAPPGAVRLDANEAPRSLPPDARRRLAEELASLDLHRYPDVRAKRLRELVAEREGAHPDQLVFGSGTDEVITFLINALARPPEGLPSASVLFPHPTFVMFRLSALSHGVTPVPVPLDPRWNLDPDAFARACAQHRPGAIFLPSPNNPTGNLFPEHQLEAVIQHARGSLVILDEAYGPYARTNYRHLAHKYPHVGRLQTLSKVGGAALRVGWAVLPVALARAVEKVRPPYNVNALSQRAAELYLTELAPSLEGMVQEVIDARERLSAALSALPGVTVHPSQANFLWVEVPGDAGAIFRALLARGVVVRSFHQAGGRLAGCLRVTIGTADDNAALVTALRASL